MRTDRPRDTTSSRGAQTGAVCQRLRDVVSRPACGRGLSAAAAVPRGRCPVPCRARPRPSAQRAGRRLRHGRDRTPPGAARRAGGRRRRLRADAGRRPAAPGGNAPNLVWVHARVEDAPLETAAYGLVTAGESLHWLEWDTVMPRFARALAPGWRAGDRRARLGRASRLARAAATRLQTLLAGPHVADRQPARRASATRPVRGRRATALWTGAWGPTVDAYVEARHSQRSFSRTHMGEVAAARVRCRAAGGHRRGVRRARNRAGWRRLRLAVSATVTWGRPRR